MHSPLSHVWTQFHMIIHLNNLESTVKERGDGITGHGFISAENLSSGPKTRTSFSFNQGERSEDLYVLNTITFLCCSFFLRLWFVLLCVCRWIVLKHKVSWRPRCVCPVIGLITAINTWRDSIQYMVSTELKNHWQRSSGRPWLRR